MESLGLLAILICILLAASISRRIQNTIITLPMVYTLFGILQGGLFLDVIPLTPEYKIIELIAELTLVIMLAGCFQDRSSRSVSRSQPLLIEI